jgi:hypothetical protein
MVEMPSKQNIDEVDGDLELRLTQLLEQISKEPIPDEIRALAGKLEAALKKREASSPRRPVRDEDQ